MIDVHCHLLPGIDDGARDEAMMVAMARAAVDSGVERILCTPHHLNGVFENSRTAILEAVAGARTILARERIDLDLNPGSELHLVPELPDRLARGDALTVNDGGRYVLVELPKHTVPVGADEVLAELRRTGVIPIVVHPERNGELRRRPSRASGWVEAGCRLQLTGQSVTGEFGESVRAVCRHWISRGEAHLVASDAHRPRGRSPRLDRARDVLESDYGEALARSLLVDNPSRLLAGAALEGPKGIERPGQATFLGRLRNLGGKISRQMAS